MHLRLTDGTTTVDLAGATTGIRGMTYFPAPGDGQVRVSESAEVIGSGTEAQIRAAVNSIERMLEGARRRAELGTGARVWLEYRPVASDSYFRSEVYDGRVVWSDEPGTRRMKDASPIVRYALLIERAPWWEGPEVELAISTNGNAAATGGRPITNDGISNWVQVANTQVEGTLPAPVRMRLTNTIGSAQYFRDFYLGLNAFGNPTGFGHLMQGENRVAGYGTSHSNANASGGSFVRVSVGTAGAYALAFQVASALTAAGGRWFRLVLRAGAVAMPSGITVRPEIWDASGLNPLWVGTAQVLRSGVDLHDLGSVPFPPGAWDTAYGEVRLLLWMQAASGTPTVEVDYIALLGTDGYRQMVQVGNQVGNGDHVEFDEIEGRHYVLTTGGVRSPLFVARGPGLRVWPGVTQRLVVVEGLATGSAPISHTFTARLWYRPRRATV